MEENIEQMQGRGGHTSQRAIYLRDRNATDDDTLSDLEENEVIDTETDDINEKTEFPSPDGKPERQREQNDDAGPM